MFLLFQTTSRCALEGGQTAEAESRGHGESYLVAPGLVSEQCGVVESATSEGVKLGRCLVGRKFIGVKTRAFNSHVSLEDGDDSSDEANSGDKAGPI